MYARRGRKLKTFADIKRRIKVGTRLHGYYHLASWDLRTRTVEIVQTNAIAFEGSAYSSGRLSWVYWPKASEIRIDGPDTFTILEDGKPLLTYTFKEGADA